MYCLLKFLGFLLKEINEVSFQQYGALVLEKYFQGFLDFYKTDQNVVMLNYNEGMKAVVEKFISFINVDYSNDELEKMYDRLKRHSKNESAVFAGDQFKEETLQIDFSKLDVLHEKLNNSLVDVLRELKIEVKFLSVLIMVYFCGKHK